MAPLDGFTDKAPAATELAQLLGALHENGVGAGFAMGVRQDRKNSSRYIVNAFQGGLGLPEREYYFFLMSVLPSNAKRMLRTWRRRLKC